MGVFFGRRAAKFGGGGVLASFIEGGGKKQRGLGGMKKFGKLSIWGERKSTGRNFY